MVFFEVVFASRAAVLYLHGWHDGEGYGRNQAGQHW